MSHQHKIGMRTGNDGSDLGWNFFNNSPEEGHPLRRLSGWPQWGGAGGAGRSKDFFGLWLGGVVMSVVHVVVSAIGKTRPVAGREVSISRIMFLPCGVSCKPGPKKIHDPART